MGLNLGPSAAASAAKAESGSRISAEWRGHVVRESHGAFGSTPGRRSLRWCQWPWADPAYACPSVGTHTGPAALI
eukprot:9213000-Pyramimonas_sp.AAC.1